MATISVNSVKDLLYAKVLYELHITKDKISYFEKKYNSKFDSFEKEIQKKEEDFEGWDDYIEWKAFNKSYKELLAQKSDIENGNIKVA